MNGCPLWPLPYIGMLACPASTFVHSDTAWQACPAAQKVRCTSEGILQTSIMFCNNAVPVSPQQELGQHACDQGRFLKPDTAAGSQPFTHYKTLADAWRHWLTISLGKDYVLLMYFYQL